MMVWVLRSAVPDFDAAHLVAIFEGRVEPGLVLDDRAADRSGVLLAAEGRSAQRGIDQRRRRLQRLVAREDRGGAVPVVGARLGDHVHHRRARAAERGRILVGGDLEFLHRVFRNVVQHAADGVVIVVGAVDGDVAAAAQLSVGRNHDRVGLGGIEVGRGRVARHQQRQLHEVASVERQRVDLLRADHAVDER